MPGVRQGLVSGRVEHGGHANLDRPGLGEDRGAHRRFQPLAGPGVGGQELRPLGVEEQAKGLEDSQLQILGPERDGLILHGIEGLERGLELDLLLLDSPPCRGRVEQDVAQVDRNDRPAPGPQLLDQIVASTEATELPISAATGLEVAVLLARDHQDGRRRSIRPLGDDLGDLIVPDLAGGGLAGRVRIGLIRGRAGRSRPGRGGRRGSDRGLPITTDVGQDRRDQADGDNRPEGDRGMVILSRKGGAGRPALAGDGSAAGARLIA